jgi:ABC-2 type transport system ATP-binding protein
MIEIKGLKKSYGSAVVLDIPELRINKGEVIGLVGNNGAGKTTLIRLLMDLIKADQGAVHVKGEDVAAHESWKMFTSAFLDDSFLIGFLTPEEYFDFIGGLYNWSHTDVINFVSKFEDVFSGEVLGKKKYIRDLSMGNRKKVGLIGTLIGNPELVYWDEPFSNLDPSTQVRVRKIIAAFADKITFVVSSHDLHHIADVCTRIVILEKGKIVKDVQRSETSSQQLLDFFGV